MIPPPSTTNLDGDEIYLYERWVIRINVFDDENIVVPIGIGQVYDIVWSEDFNTWVIKDIYDEIAEVLAEVYNKEVDEPISDTCHPNNGVVKVDYLWKIDDIEPEDVVFTEIE